MGSLGRRVRALEAGSDDYCSVCGGEPKPGETQVNTRRFGWECDAPPEDKNCPAWERWLLIVAYRSPKDKRLAHQKRSSEENTR